MNLGRHELIQWVNQIAQAEYPSVQSLCDGVAYCQILQAVHPGSVNMSRLTLLTRLPLQCLRNLKILQSALKNMKISMTVSIQKMANGRFQDNITFTQWLYTHAQKYGQDNIRMYDAYERRMQILQKQGKRWDQVNVHLMPNQVYQQHDQQEEEEREEYGSHERQEQQNFEIQQKIGEIGNYLMGLEGELKEKMELNWRTMHMIGRSIEERNALYNLLEQIEKTALKSGESPAQKEILRILYEKPKEFRQSNR